MTISLRLPRILPLAGIIALSPLSLLDAKASLADQYLCSAGDLVYNVMVNPLEPGSATLSGPISDNAPAAARQSPLFQVQAPNGIRYEGGNARFFGAPGAMFLQIGTALLDWRLEAEPGSEAQTGGELPPPASGDPELVSAAGRSLGGVLRAGPGMQHARVGSLREGTPLTILRRTPEVMNGYDWFEVRTGDGRSGYQWGGIMCSEGTQVDGIFQVCQGRRPANVSTGNQNVRPRPAQSAKYSALITVTNRTDDPVDLVYVPENGRAELTARIPPFASVNINTTLGHRFQLVRGDAIYSEFTVQRSQGQQILFQN